MPKREKSGNPPSKLPEQRQGLFIIFILKDVLREMAQEIAPWESAVVPLRPKP